MIRIILFLILISTIFSCQKREIKKLANKPLSPYEVFFDNLVIENNTDTILVPFQTHIFGCGTAYLEFQEKLEKKGLDKFYDKYNNIFNDSSFIKKYEIKNRTKILWIFRGNEGEFNQLADSLLHKNQDLEKRILASKNYVSISENPISMSSLEISVSINYPNTKKYVSKNYFLSIKSEKWVIDKVLNY